MEKPGVECDPIDYYAETLVKVVGVRYVRNGFLDISCLVARKTLEKYFENGNVFCYECQIGK